MKELQNPHEPDKREVDEDTSKTTTKAGLETTATSETQNWLGVIDASIAGCLIIPFVLLFFFFFFGEDFHFFILFFFYPKKNTFESKNLFICFAGLLITAFLIQIFLARMTSPIGECLSGCLILFSQKILIVRAEVEPIDEPLAVVWQRMVLDALFYRGDSLMSLHVIDSSMVIKE